jgi:hypothetical protein
MGKTYIRSSIILLLFYLIACSSKNTTPPKSALILPEPSPLSSNLPPSSSSPSTSPLLSSNLPSSKTSIEPPSSSSSPQEEANIRAETKVDGIFEVACGRCVYKIHDLRVCNTAFRDGLKRYLIVGEYEDAYTLKLCTTKKQASILGTLVENKCYVERLKFQEYLLKRHPYVWAMSVSALQIEVHGEHHAFLGGKPVHPQTQKEKIWSLREKWEISNRSELLKKLEWFLNEGDRKIFDFYYDQIKSLSPEEFSAYSISKASLDVQRSLEVVKEYGKKMAETRQSLLGWDYSHYVFLCRWGYLAGYLSEAECYQKILEVSYLVQKSFNSWEEFGENVLIGLQFCSYSQMKHIGHLWKEAYHHLITLPESPWKLCPWTMNLQKREFKK